MLTIFCWSQFQKFKFKEVLWMLPQWFLTSIWQTVVQIPILKHNYQECQLMQSDEREHVQGQPVSPHTHTIQKLDKTEKSWAGQRCYLSGCNASSSAWSQEPCTTGWPRTRSSHHPCAGPGRNPGSTQHRTHQLLQGNNANNPAQTIRQSLNWREERWESCKTRLWNQISQPVKRH